MEHAVFFSGTHGTGKTKTIDKIKEQFGFEMFFSGDGDHGNPYVNPFHRQVWRLNKHFLDSSNIFEEQSKLEKGLLLADRCIFDYKAYTNAFHILGWISENEYQKLENLLNVYFDNNAILPQNIVLFFPPEEWTIDRIKQRWNEEKKKWNEGDFNYLHVVREQFLEVCHREEKNRNILLVHETDLDQRIKIISPYLKQIVKKVY